MQRLHPRTAGMTLNIIEENIEMLRGLFPDDFTEDSDDEGPRWKTGLGSDLRIQKRIECRSC